MGSKTLRLRLECDLHPFIHLGALKCHLIGNTLNTEGLISLMSLAEAFALIFMSYCKKNLVALCSLHDFFLYKVNNELGQISKIKKKKYCN